MSSGARVFVRLYDGATQREGDGELLMLPPPPLTWKGVLSMMIMAVTKQDDDPQEQAIARARLFLLPTDPQGIVAELNARSLRFGVRDNDQFAVCLHGEEYKKPQDEDGEANDMTSSTTTTTDAAAVAALTAMASLPALAVTTSRLNDYQQQPTPTPTHQANTTNDNGPPRGSGMFTSNYTTSSNAPPSSTILGNNTSNRKSSKRYRSISGKMAAIKSLGDKGLITAEDRGHLKDLLLNNDSPALQDALDNYQNTGDFQQVKQLLLQELHTPSAKRGTGDWLPESLINELSANFQTHDNEGGGDNDGGDNDGGAHEGASRYERYAATNPFMYGSHTSSSTTAPTSHASPSAASEYDHAVHPVDNSQDPTAAWTASSSSSSTGYGSSGGLYNNNSNSAPSTPQIHLPLRNRNSVNLMLKHRSVDGGGSNSPVSQQQQQQQHEQQQQQQVLMHGNPVEIGYAAAPVAYAMASHQHQQHPHQGYASMGYASSTPSAVSPAEYSHHQMAAMNGYAVPTAPMGYSPYYRQQQLAQPHHAMGYAVSPYGHQVYAGTMDGGAYAAYYGTPQAYGGGGYMRGGGAPHMMGGAVGGAYGMPLGAGGRMSMGGKWTTAPPMPAYPPPCSKEEKKEKIAKWLTKRANRNWSNKPSYPVRHNIAKNRKRGEDGRFITKKRLAEMEKEEQARIAAGLPPTLTNDNDQELLLDQYQYEDEEGGDGSDQETGFAGSGMGMGDTFATGMPTATAIHM